MLSSIQLPNGTQWTFNYNSWGDLSTVTTPTGGTITYTWGYVWFESLSEDSYRRIVLSRTIDANDGTGPKVWIYNANALGSPQPGVTDPDGNVTAFSGPDGCGPMFLGWETKTYYQNTSNGYAHLKTTTTSYSCQESDVFSYIDGMTSGINPLVTSTTTTWANGDSFHTQTSYDSSATFYDINCKTNCGQPTPFTYGSATQQQVFDYGGSLLRETDTHFKWQDDNSFLNANLLDRAVTVTIPNGSKSSTTTYGYDETDKGSMCSTLPCGDLTSVTRTLVGGVSPVTHTAYNIQGMRTFEYDANGNPPTQYQYDGTGAFVNEIDYPLGQKELFTYDANTGLMTSHTDRNNRPTSYTYDSLRRPLSIVYPLTDSQGHAGGGSEVFIYSDALPTPSFTFTKQINGGPSFEEIGTVDGFGRQIRTQVGVAASTCTSGYVTVDTTYDNEGRKFSTSNPYCTTGDTTYGISSTYYDALGRPVLTVPPDGTAPTSNLNITCLSNDICTSYLGKTTTVTDETGRQRSTVADALGRSPHVIEDPNGMLHYDTYYTYDPLGNLLNVAQGGSRQRTFVYDSLSRLTQSTNPESNTTTTGTVATIYSYDANGNLQSKTDARGQTTSFCYDALNRVTVKSWATDACHDPAPVATYSYDNQVNCVGQPSCYNVGHRTGMSDAGGSESVSYDQMGRELTVARTTNSATKSTTYSYNYDGSIASLTYPTGNIITYSYDQRGLPTAAVDMANAINYATGGVYAPQGALSALTVGSNATFTGINVNNAFNKRFQPSELKAWSTAGTAMDLTYSFYDANGHNNGNVWGIANNLDTTRSQTFNYDGVNRVSSAHSGTTSGTNCWGEAFGYDQWANLLSITDLTGYTGTGCTRESLGLSVGSDNRISNLGFSYDPSGNLLNDTTYTYTWNPESQMATAAGVTYIYDGDGNRVAKANTATPPVPYKLYWYGTGSEVLDESDGSGAVTDEYIFFQGKRIARRHVGP